MSAITPQQRDSALASLAILKVNFDRDQDYISNFVPFVAEVLRRHAPQAVALADVQAGVEDGFGLCIPQGALNTILRRMARRKLVTISLGTYRPDLDALGESEFPQLRETVAKQERMLVQRLVAHAENEYGLPWDEPTAEQALLQFVDGRTATLLCADHRSALAGVHAPVHHTEVIVASFIEHLAGTDTQWFEFFLSIVQGTMLANVLYMPGGLNDVKRRFGSTRFFLDTSFVLRALGYTSKAMSAPCLELVEMLRGQDAALRVFEHTMDEIDGILEAGIRELRAGGGDLIGQSEFLIQDRWSASDVEEFRLHLRSKLAALDIQIERKPAHSPQHVIDEQGLEAALKQAMPNLRREGIRRDVDSLSAVHRLRGGHARPRLEDADAMFVTTTRTLAYTGGDFYRKEYGREGVPWCIDADTLTTLAWLKQPTAAPDLPRLQVIADCYAAMRPPEALWEKYRDQIKRIGERGEISPDDCHLLRYSDEARRALMLETHGDPEVFTEGTIHQVLDRAHTNATSETRAQLAAAQQARETEAREAAETLAAAKQRAEQREQEHAAAAEAARAREQELKNERDRATQRQAAHIDKLTDRFTRFLSLPVLVILVVAILFGAAASISPLSDVLDDIPVVPQIATKLLVALAVGGAIWGISATSLRRHSERLIRPRIHALISAVAADDDRSDSSPE
jgi:hypothetical protein